MLKHYCNLFTFLFLENKIYCFILFNICHWVFLKKKIFNFFFRISSFLQTALDKSNRQFQRQSSQKFRPSVRANLRRWPRNPSSCKPGSAASPWNSASSRKCGRRPRCPLRKCSLRQWTNLRICWMERKSLKLRTSCPSMLPHTRKVQLGRRR